MCLAFDDLTEEQLNEQFGRDSLEVYLMMQFHLQTLQTILNVVII